MAKQALQNGAPVPDPIRNAPTLILGSELYMDAYLELQHDRPVGMSAGAIPWTAIESYGRANGFDAEQLETLHYTIRKADETWLKWQADRGNAE